MDKDELQSAADEMYVTAEEVQKSVMNMLDNKIRQTEVIVNTLVMLFEATGVSLDLSNASQSLTTIYSERNKLAKFYGFPLVAHGSFKP